MDREPTPDELRQAEERRELFRQCQARIVANHEAGRSVDPLALKQARQYLSRTKPLGRPLSDGTPARACAHFAPEENIR